MEYEAEKNYGEATMEAVENFDGFNWNNLNERDDYIKLAKNYISFPEGLKQFINKKYGEICGIPESELHAFIEEHSRQRGVDLHKQTIGNWLSSDEKKKGSPQGCSDSRTRKNMYKLCFALDFTVKETEEFFGKVYLERPYDSRNVEEAVYLFCMNNHYTFGKAEELIRLIDAGNPSGKENASTITKTQVLRSEILKLKNESDFLAYMDVNRNNFGIKNHTAGRYYIKLLEDAKKMTRVTSNTKLLDKIYGREKEVIQEDSKAAKEDSKAAKEDSKAAKKKNSFFLDIVKMNFPQKKQLSDIKLGKASYDTIRKALILLKFYSFFMHVGEDHSEDDREQFYQETDDMLSECGYWPLYPRNPYDWIFMYCAACSHDLQNRYLEISQPLEELKDIMTNMLDF